MAFEWHKIHKFEEGFEREIRDTVEQYVLEYYTAESLEDLTAEDVAAITAFRDELNPYSVMQIGFSELLSTLEDLDE